MVTVKSLKIRKVKPMSNVVCVTEVIRTKDETISNNIIENETEFALLPVEEQANFEVSDYVTVDEDKKVYTLKLHIDVDKNVFVSLDIYKPEVIETFEESERETLKSLQELIRDGVELKQPSVGN